MSKDYDKHHQLGGFNKIPKNFNPDKFFQSDAANRITYNYYQNYIMKLAMNRFRWKNLPETCDERYLEYTLLMQGAATIAFPKDTPNVFYSTMVTQKSPLNVYDNPTEWQSYGNNGWNFECTPENGVIVWDNSIRIPIWNFITIEASRLAMIDRTIDINIFWQRLPMFITADQDMKNDVVQVIKQMAGGEPAVIGTKMLSEIVDNIKSVPNPTPFIAEELQSVQATEWNKIHSFLGIESMPHKSERMIQEEVDAISEPSEIMKLDPLESRRKAAKELNGRFGLNIEVYWNKDYQSDTYNYMHNIEAQAEQAYSGITFANEVGEAND